MPKELKGLQESPKPVIHTDLLKITQKKYQTGKHQVVIAYMIFGSRNPPPFTTDKH